MMLIFKERLFFSPVIFVTLDAVKLTNRVGKKIQISKKRSSDGVPQGNLMIHKGARESRVYYNNQ